VKWPKSLTGCLRPTPADNLPILAGIQPARFRLKRATVSPSRHAMGPGNLLHLALISSQGGNARHLKSRQPIVLAAQLISSSDENNRSGPLWADHRCNKQWLENTTRLRAFIPDIQTHLPGMALIRTAWFRLNRLAQVSEVSVPACTNKLWPIPQIVGVAQKNRLLAMLFLIVLHLLFTVPPHGAHGLTLLDDDAIGRLLNICLEM